MSKKVVLLSQGGKGGVGKTMVMVHLYEYLRSKGIGVIALDLDDENKRFSSLQHWVPDAKKRRITDKEGLDVILDASDLVGEGSGAEVILADLKAGMGFTSFHWFKDVGVALKGEVVFVLIGVVTEDSATVSGLIEWAAALKDLVEYVVFLNPTAEGSSDFSGFEENPEVKKFIGLADPGIATVPSVISDLMVLCREHGVTLRQVAEGDHDVEELKSTRWKIRARAAWQAFVEAFDSVFHKLIPIEVDEVEAKPEPAKKGKREAAKA